MPQAIRIDAVGGPDVMQLVDNDVSAPGPDEIRLRHTAIGVNFIDTYHRSGLYPLPLPAGIGLEAVGIVEAIGPNVVDFAEGDRVGYCFGPPGAYATHRLIAADMVAPVPDGVSDKVAAAVMLKGCTAEFLIERCARVEAGQVALVHAAAGGVGQLLVQWLRSAGATVIATVGDPQKAAIAREAGADEVILYRDEDVEEAIAVFTKGVGVDVVFDGVGQTTWEASLKSLRRRGLLVSFGNASGAVTGVDLLSLARNGSLFVTRPTLADYYTTAEERRAGLAKLFSRLADGMLTVTPARQFALADAAQAHTALEGRSTTGSIILIP